MSETQRRPRQKKILWAAAVLLIIVAAAWWAWKALAPVSPLPLEAGTEGEGEEEKFVIAVAPFWGPDEKSMEEGRAVQRLAEETLRQELGAEEGVTILAEEAEEPPRTDEEAKNLGEALRADIVVWGHVFVFPQATEIRHNFTAMAPLRWLREEERSIEVLFAPPEQGGVKKTEVEELRSVALLVAAAYHQDEPDKALRFLQKFDPPTVDSLRWQGNIYYLLNKQKEAADLFEKAIALAKEERYGRLRPEDAVLLSDLGWVYSEQAKYEESLTIFQEAVELDPNNAEAHDALGWSYCFGEQYDYEKALAAFQKVVELDPEYADVHNSLGWLHYHEGEYEKAVAELETPMTDPETGAEYPAVEAEYSDGYVQLTYAHALVRTGRGEEAQTPIKELAKVFEGEESPGWPAPLAFFYLGEATEEEVLEAAKSDDETLEQEQKCEAYYYIGMAHLLGVGAFGGAPPPEREAKAREHFEKCLATDAAITVEYRSAGRELERLH
jgi:tetratricopeptide (TPR) repeat protein